MMDCRLHPRHAEGVDPRRIEEERGGGGIVGWWSALSSGDIYDDECDDDECDDDECDEYRDGGGSGTKRVERRKRRKTTTTTIRIEVWMRGGAGRRPMSRRGCEERRTQVEGSNGKLPEAARMPDRERSGNRKEGGGSETERRGCDWIVVAVARAARGGIPCRRRRSGRLPRR
ncbi:hypothetical protein ACHAW5_005755 [Stephanodiscus triporus]|uniref:Uncharacterized protein n=1 Tax=Stephanodiscus triporus TaxID=2934178 RepID=A0ABD3NWP6_9STRA